MFPAEANCTKLAHKVNLVNPNLMGTFTKDVNVVTTLYDIGIPVWLLRPFDMIPPNTNICHEYPEEFDRHIMLQEYGALLGQSDGPPFPMVYQGPPGSKMQQAMQRLGCCFQDLVEVTAIGRHCDNAEGNSDTGSRSMACAAPAPGTITRGNHSDMGT
ncbi:hypothetical protein DXG01_001316 [Tephrocybe rancida]|nr:hypothetical protein DXG01_001316 [Tephrocybe rancida]